MSGLNNFIFINAGQCGNQLGYSLLSHIHAHLMNLDDDHPDKENLISQFFRNSNDQRRHKTLNSRAVCIDTEPKVINECLQKSRTESLARENGWTIDPKSTVYRHGGAGNNWALGYEMTSGEFLEVSLDLIRREIEFCDFPQILTFIHSVAGGTGSGLGYTIL